MRKTKLKAFKIASLEFKNNVQGSVSLNFQTNVTHNVRYVNGTNTCEAIFKATVNDPKNPNAIACTIELRGIYSHDPKAIKEEVHTETCKELFAYAKTYVSAISGMAGMKPIIIGDIDFDNQQILRYNKNTFKDMFRGGNPPQMDDTIDGPDGSEE